MDIREIELQLGAETMPYGPAMPVAEGGVEIASTFGAYEAEYAAIRRHVGVMHLPQRAVLRFTGDDRQDFLHRMVTQDIRGMAGGATRRSFLLNQKGRIVADMIVHHGDADTWLEMDAIDLPDVRTLLDARLFAEDVTMHDLTDQRTALALYGPASSALLAAVTTGNAGQPPQTPGIHQVLRLLGRPVTVYRRDDAGSPGLHLLAPREDAARLYQALLDAAGYEPDAAPDADFAARRRQSLRGRPIGWHAYNTARIEEGSPVFHIDFGTDSLPGETGILDQAVSFNKGCYLGQEIVARMKNLGHPRRILVGLRFDSPDLPVAGAQVLDPGDRATVIGGVTSSTLSPIRGNLAIAFAVMKWGRHEPDAAALVPAEGRLVQAHVQKLAFLEE